MNATAAPNAGEAVLVRDLVDVNRRKLDTRRALTETDGRHVHEEPLR